MQRNDKLLLLFLCLLLANPLFGQITADPEELNFNDTPTGAIFTEEITLTNNGDAEIGFTAVVETIDPDRNFGPARDRRNDPDDMSYEWRDNLEDDGPEFEWINLADYENVRNFQLGDDQNTGAVPIGWTFPFWDREFEQIFIDSDGWTSFTYGGRDISVDARNYPSQANGVRENTIAVFNTDYGNARVGFWTNENDQAIISWVGNNQHHHQLILHESGLAVMQYGQAIQNRGCMGVGANLGDGEHGFFICGDDRNYLTDGRAIGFGPGNGWLSWIVVTPEAGDIPGDDEFPVNLNINAVGLEEDDYAAEVTFSFDEGRDIVIPVSMNIIEGPAIYTEAMEWDFGDAWIGFDNEAVILVENVGYEDLVIEEITSDDPDNFHGEDPPDRGWRLDPGDVVEIFIYTSPVEPGEVDGVLTFISNALNAPEYQFPVHANGLLPPIISIELDEIEDDMNTGDVEEYAVTVVNDGDHDLIYEVDHEFIGERRDQVSRSVRSTNNPPGPRRDEVDLGGMMFAVLQDERAWQWLDDMMMEQDPLLTRNGDDANYVTFRGWDAWNEINFEEYDAIVYAGGRQSGNFHNAFNQNLERFVEYIDGGGGVYTETGDRNSPIRIPGGFNNDSDGNNNGTLVVSPDSNDDNYSLLAEIFHESQPDFWNEGEVIEGNSFLHSSYSLGQFDEALDNGTIEWWQNIAVPQGRQTAGVVAYGIGSGTVMAVGHPIGYGWNRWRGEGNWGSMAAEILYYLTEMGGNNWISYEPTEGVIEPDSDTDIIVILDAAGLLTGDYQCDLMISSNAPNNPNAIIPVIIHVTGAPDLQVVWANEAGYPDLIDWNRAYDEVFSGGPYDIVVDLCNEGTEVLHVEDVMSEHEYFFADFEQEFEIEAGESIEMTFTYESPEDEPGDFEGVMIISSDDPNTPEYQIPLHAESTQPPLIVVDPEAFDEEVHIGSHVEHVINIGNEGEALLHGIIEIEVLEEPDRDVVVRNVRKTSPDRTLYRDRRNEPDDMGYEWRDNLEDDGPEFEWIDLNDFDNVRNFQLGDDQNTGAVALGWTFPFWDREFEQIYIDSDGWTSFTYGGRDISVDARNYPSQANGVRENTIAVFNTDYGRANVNFWTNGSDQAIVSWIGNDQHHHQLILNDRGLGVMQYGQNIQNRGCMGVGVNLGDGQHGFFICGDDRNYLTDGRAIGFGPARGWTSWISVDTEEFEVEPGADNDVVMTLDAGGLDLGQYAGVVRFLSNDPANPEIEVGVDYLVRGAPDVDPVWEEDFGYPDIVDWNLAYEEVFTGGPYEIIVEISNLGTRSLTITDIYSEHEYFSSTFEGEDRLRVDETIEVGFIFDAPADDPGDFNANMIIESNDPDEEELSIRLHAEAERPPIIDADPVGIEDEIITGAQVEYTVTLSNSGDATLIWDSEWEVMEAPDLDRLNRQVRQTESNVGPCRDEVDIEGMRFACFQDNGNWGWLDEGWRRDPLLNNDNFVSYRNGNSWNDVDFNEFNAIVMSTYDQRFNNQYNANLERFCEYIDGGGALYAEMGDANRGLRTPGGIMNDWGINSNNGFLAVSPDPDDGNYSLFAEICHESQPNFWELDECIEGNSWLHSGFQLAQFNEGVDEGTLEWFQVIAVHERDRNAPGAITYGYGGGTVMVVGHPVGHCWYNWTQEGQWGSIGAEILYYLTSAGGMRGWFTFEPTEGEIDQDEEEDVFIHINGIGLQEGLYVVNLHFLNNDPSNPDLVVEISLEIIGAPNIVLEWDEDYGFPDMIDWNAAYDELFSGGPYNIPVQISNSGTDPLEIEEFISDNEFFMTDVEDELELDPDEETEVNFIFNAPAEEPGDYDATITIVSNDPDDGELEVILHAEALSPPVISIDPLAIEIEAFSGAFEEHIINVSNEGEATLQGEIDIVVLEEEDRDNTYRSMRNIDSYRSPLRDRRNEPDDMGYEWRDNLEDDGPEFEWLDLNDFENVRNFQLGDDQNTGAVPLGWTFPFWDREFEQIYIDSDGWTSFTYGGRDIGVDARNYPIQANGVRENTIAVFNTDYGNARVGFWTNESDQAIISWVGNNQHNHQLILFESGLSVMQYGQNIQNRGCMGVGANLGDGEHGFFICGDDRNYLTDGRAIAFGPARAWLSWISMEVETFELEQNEDVDLGLYINAEGLEGGDYEAEVHFLNNDPSNPDAVVSVIMDVTPAPDIVVEWDELIGWPNIIDWNEAFEEVFAGGPYVIPIQITNGGLEVLCIEGAESDNEYFYSDFEGEFELGVDESVEVNFFFDAEEPGDYNEIMVITSDDPDEMELEIRLHGEASAPPRIAVEPLEISDDLNDGETDEHSFVIANEGEAVLRWQTEFETISEPEPGDQRDRGVRSMRRTDGSQIGPRRDEVDLDGMIFAVLQDERAWQWLDEMMMEQDPLLTRNGDDANYVTFRGGDAWNNIDFEEYDAIVYAGGRQSGNFHNAYNQNLERFVEYIDGGGGVYTETGDRNAQIRIPGGFNNDSDGNNNGTLVVSPDPNADNYSFLAEIFHESQPDFWNEGEVIEGNSFLHSSYSLGQFDQALDNGTIEWWQNIAVPQGRQTAGVVAYGIGSGTVMAVGHPIGYGWNRWRGEGNWGSMAAEILFYLTEMGGSKWCIFETTEGEIEPDNEEEFFLTLGGEGLYEGHYDGDLHIFNNDPSDPDVIVNIGLDVTGLPQVEAVWDEEFGYPDRINWNRAYPEALYSGGSYPVPITFINHGMGNLHVESIVNENEFFYAEPNEDFIVGFDFRRVVNFYINADEDGMHAGNMTIITDDPDNGEISIRCVGETTPPPRIVVDPDDPIEEALFVGESAEHALNITNEGEVDLVWWTDYVAREPGEERDQIRRGIRRVDPRESVSRDDPGDQLFQFDLRHQWIGGFDWDPDNNTMWVGSYSPNWIHSYVYDGNGNVEVDFDRQLNRNSMAMGYMDGIVYTNEWSNRTIYRYDTDGNNIGNVNSDCDEIMDYGTSKENGWLFAFNGNNRNIHVYDVNDNYQRIGMINGPQVYNQMNNQWSRAMCWVDDHPDGQLWLGTNNHVWQFFVDTDNWRAELVQDFQVASDNEWCAIGHDGENLWRGNSLDNQRVIVYDEGVAELRWFSYEPSDGTLEPDEDTEVILTLNAESILGGLYEVEFNIFSNDPVEIDEVPDVTIPITFDVSGIPDIDVDPGGSGHGRIDFENVYLGQSATVMANVLSSGSDELVIEDIVTDNEVFDITDEVEFPIVIQAEDETLIPITYEPVEAGRNQRGTLLFMTNVEEWEDGYPVSVTGDALVAPEIRLSADRHDFGVTPEVNDRVSWTLEVFNDGGDDLDVEVEVEGEVFTSFARAFSVRPDRSRDVRIRFRPNEEGEHVGRLIIRSNDPVNPVLFVGLRGFCGDIRLPHLTVSLSEGWNISSINVDPLEFYPDEDADGPDVIRMFEQARIDDDNHRVELLKDEDGRFWAPSFNFSNIPHWNLTEGYQIKMTEDFEVVFEGVPIPPDADIPLEPGWNLIAYFPTYDLDASGPDFYVLSPIIDNVELAKDSEGRFLSPLFGFSNMLPWTEGQGYQVNVSGDEEIVLNYPPEQEEAAFALAFEDQVGHWAAPIPTGENMSLLVNSITDYEFAEDDQIAAYSSSGVLLGTGNVRNGRIGLAIWGDDESTKSIEGALPDELFKLKFWNSVNIVERDLEVELIHAGNGLVYEVNSLVVVDANIQVAIPDDYYLSQNYPNPFNNITRLAFGMVEKGDVSIWVYDLSGRIVTTLINGEVNAGNHEVIWEASSTTSGIYLIKMQTSSGFKAVRKVMLIK